MSGASLKLRHYLRNWVSEHGEKKMVLGRSFKLSIMCKRDRKYLTTVIIAALMWKGGFLIYSDLFSRTVALTAVLISNHKFLLMEIF